MLFQRDLVFGACEALTEARSAQPRPALLRQSAAFTFVFALEDDQKEAKMESVIRQQCVRGEDGVERRPHVKARAPLANSFEAWAEPSSMIV